MCNECVATELITGTEMTMVKDGVTYIMRARVGEFQIKKGGEWGDNWISTDDLAGVVSDVGFDVKVRCFGKNHIININKYINESKMIKLKCNENFLIVDDSGAETICAVIDNGDKNFNLSLNAGLIKVKK